MPKRKRGNEATLRDTLEKYENEVFRALKASKGFERQRLSKRLRDPGVTPDKARRIEREISVLKTLDLHQTARAHLHISLLKAKPIATAPTLPDELRRGVSKPNLPEEEQIALHNITSALYNRDAVKKVIGQAVPAVCDVMGLAATNGGKRHGRDKSKERDIQNVNRGDLSSNSPEPSAAGAQVKEEPEFEGFSDPCESDGISVNSNADTDADEEEVAEYEKLGDLLGESSDEEGEWDDDKYAHLRGRETVNLDDISLSGSDEESEADAGMEHSIQPPASAHSQGQDKSRKAARISTSGTPVGSTFLPTLMGGYISGSESASDVEDARPKKRRGQRARQAIWEKKYGSGAKHLQQPVKSRGRDQGWDARRGAVNGEDQGKKTSWRKGKSVGSSTKSRELQGPGPGTGYSVPLPKVTKRDDQGPLHPSWEARKKAKESQKQVAFTGQKVVFD